MKKYIRLLKAAKALSKRFGTGKNLTEQIQELDLAIEECSK